MLSPTHVCNLLPCYATRQIDECSCDSRIASTKTQAWSLQTLKTHTSPSHLVIKCKSSTLLCVCLCSNLLTRKCYDGFQGHIDDDRIAVNIYAGFEGVYLERTPLCFRQVGVLDTVMLCERKCVSTTNQTHPTQIHIYIIIR